MDASYFALFIVILSGVVYIICGAVAKSPGREVVGDIKTLAGYAFLAGMIGLVIKGITA